MADKFPCKKCGTKTEGVEVRSLFGSGISPFCRECHIAETEKSQKKNMKELWIVLAILLGLSIGLPLLIGILSS